ncbi:MAG: methyltransferase family protein [Methanobacterium sp.]
MSVTVNLANQMLLFPSSNAALVFNLILVIWILSEIVGVTIIPRIRRKGVKIESRDRISGSVIFASIFISIIISYYFAVNAIAILPGWTYYIGISLMILGILLRQWSIWVLGRFFSGVVGVQENQKVIDRGPYAYVRHPSYTGALMILVGIGLAVQSWGAAIMLIVLFAIAYGYRIYVEEKAMISQFGDEYIQYAKRTKRIIPFIV